MKKIKLFLFALLISLLAGLTACTSQTDSQENQSAENPATPAPENPDTPDPEIAACDAALTPGYYTVVTRQPRILYAPGDTFSMDGLEFNLYADDGTLVGENCSIAWFNYYPDNKIFGADTSTEGEHTVRIYFRFFTGDWNSETLEYTNTAEYYLCVSLSITVRAITSNLYPDATLTTDELETFDYASFGNLSLSVPLDSTSVDVWELFEAMQTLKEKAEAQTALDGVPRVVTFAAYPASVTTFVIKNNLELMAKAVNPETYPFTAEGQQIETELVPGINVVTNASEWVASNDKTIQQALKFSDATKKVDLSQTVYDLTGTYQGGIIGDVDFENLANTTIGGKIKGKSNISPFYEKFIESRNAENLPNLTLSFSGFSTIDFESDNVYGDETLNLYGTNIDLIAKKIL